MHSTLQAQTKLIRGNITGDVKRKGKGTGYIQKYFNLEQ